MKYQIDDIDRKILSYLVKNARVPFLEIARECGISGAAIHQRVKKMEDAGIIEGSRFIVKHAHWDSRFVLSSGSFWIMLPNIKKLSKK